MVGRDYKRKYVFKTDTSGERRYFNWIVIILLILLVLWYVF